MESQRRTVLIVDDDPQVLRLVETMLRARNVKLVGAPRPSEALRICETEAVHLLISDVVMPEMDGNRLAGLVLKMHPEAHVLLISGRHNEAPMAAKSDRVLFLRKPFFPSQLLQHLKELLPDI